MSAPEGVVERPDNIEIPKGLRDAGVRPVDSHPEAEIIEPKASVAEAIRWRLEQLKRLRIPKKEKG